MVTGMAGDKAAEDLIIRSDGLVLSTVVFSIAVEEARLPRCFHGRSVDVWLDSMYS